MLFRYPEYINGVNQDKEFYFKVTQEEFSIEIVTSERISQQLPEGIC